MVKKTAPMGNLELQWSNPNYNNGELIREQVQAYCFEDAAEDWFKRLAVLGFSEHECYWKITDSDTTHVWIEMNKTRCLIRGW
jgi:hypothetical protein